MPGYCACAGCKNSTKTGHSSMASRRTRQPFDSGFTLSEAGTFFNDLRHRQYQDLQRAFQGGLRRRGCQNGITRVEDREAKLIPTTVPSVHSTSPPAAATPRGTKKAEMLR
ncbi:hypothetical protein N1851_026198 [Merluccius polli]|uniref:Uncharacterized protein n=1 Tax=Merluccius polli TaxID=89951 RepID=A0AA47MCG4_MERPO|nr:hypothetical protein N1851_026198 [Merluccius polli]